MKTTLTDEHTLPKLPVPDLRSTGEAVQYLIAPLTSEAGLRRTLTAVEELLLPDGPGEILQRRLLDWQASLPGNSSWLRPLWDDLYLSWRGALPLEMNYFFRLGAQRWGGEAALPRLTRAMALLFDSICRHTLPPEQARDKPLSMDQALSCFYTRIPGESADSLVPAADAPVRYAAVVCNGHWHLLCLRREDGSMPEEEALRCAFNAIRKETKDLPPPPKAAAFTGAPRQRAAALRSRLQKTLRNRLHLAAIEKAMFVICLDEPHSSADDLASRLLGGEAACRWFDKSLQIIATANGGLGVNLEHAGCDAAIWVYLLGLADAEILAPKGKNADAASGKPSASRSDKDKESPLYQRLIWDIAPDLAQALEEEAEDFARRCAEVDIICREYPEFSRETVKSLRTAPDAFYQIAFQSAQVSLFGRMRSSYEAVAMRAYAGGRTECARGSTAEALAFATALIDRQQPQNLLSLFRRAENAHCARLSRCQRGHGVERHLAGLQAMYSLFGPEPGLERLPFLFEDPGWLSLKHDALSTSGIGAPFIRFFGFGPTVSDGFGIGYAPGSDRFGLIVTALRPSGLCPDCFAGAFAHAAEQIVTALGTEEAPV